MCTSVPLNHILGLCHLLFVRIIYRECISCCFCSDERSWHWAQTERVKFLDIMNTSPKYSCPSLLPFTSLSTSILVGPRTLVRVRPWGLHWKQRRREIVLLLLLVWAGLHHHDVSFSPNLAVPPSLNYMIRSAGWRCSLFAQNDIQTVSLLLSAKLYGRGIYTDSISLINCALLLTKCLFIIFHLCQ